MRISQTGWFIMDFFFFYVNGWFGSNPISRTPHMFFYIWLVVWIFVIFPYIGNTHPNWLSYFSDRLKSTDVLFGLRYVQACEVKIQKHWMIDLSDLQVTSTINRFTYIYIYHIYIYIYQLCNIYIYIYQLYDIYRYTYYIFLYIVYIYIHII